MQLIALSWLLIISNQRTTTLSWKLFSLSKTLEVVMEVFSHDGEAGMHYQQTPDGWNGFAIRRILQQV
jgi:hypothetical protein